MQPKYKHNCERCKYLGTEVYLETTHDFYICALNPEATRLVVARYGDSSHEYMVNRLFVSEVLTDMDRLALFRGLELTDIENQKLFRVLAQMYRRGFTVPVCERLIGPTAFGNGNIVFPKDNEGDNEG